jgi:hypothetical protein
LMDSSPEAYAPFSVLMRWLRPQSHVD